MQIVAIDMSAEFRAAIRDVLPRARIAADHWHVMTRANQMVTQSGGVVPGTCTPAAGGSWTRPGSTAPC